MLEVGHCTSHRRRHAVCLIVCVVQCMVRFLRLLPPPWGVNSTVERISAVSEVMRYVVAPGKLAVKMTDSVVRRSSFARYKEVLSWVSKFQFFFPSVVINLDRRPDRFVFIAVCFSL